MPQTINTMGKKFDKEFYEKMIAELYSLYKESTLTLDPEKENKSALGKVIILLRGEVIWNADVALEKSDAMKVSDSFIEAEDTPSDYDVLRATASGKNKIQHETLLEDYKRRLETVNLEIKKLPHDCPDNPTRIRLIAKASCYRGFIEELKIPRK